MRRVLSLLGVVSAVPVVLAVPVVTPPAVSPRPVAPHVAQLVVAPMPATTGVVADTGKQATKPFTLAGATFRRGTLAAGSHVELRTRSHGAWSSWTPLSMPDGGPDDGSPDARAAAVAGSAATEPVYVGAADGVEARVVDGRGDAAAAPEDLHVVLVDGGSSAADTSPGPPHPLGGVVEAAQAQPQIYTRAQWGADESLRTRNSGCSTPSYGSTIKMGFVHHTDGANSYAAGDVPSILRSIYAYHVESNGWCDVGYNFLVDRFGRIWEGRYGGIDKPVIGAHTGGFNTDTFAASLIGTYSTTKPSTAMLTAVEQLFAWKLGKYYLDPHGKATTVAGSFSGSRYAAGSTVTFNVISGHRDADQTSCPGNAAYSLLPTIRDGVAQLIGAGFVAPSIAPASIRMLSGQTVAVKARALDAVTWSLAVSDANGTTLRTLTGTADPAAAVGATWDGAADNGTPVPPGTYTLSLAATDANGSTAVPYTRRVTVTPPVTISVPPTASYGDTVPVTGTATPNGTVTVSVQRGSQPAQDRSVTATSAGTWSTSIPADDDYSLTASVPGWTTPAVTLKIGPALTSPALPDNRTLFVRAGSALTLGGTGLPGSAVQLVTTTAGQSPVTGPSLQVRGDGSWSGGSVKPTNVTTVVAQRDSATASSPVTVYPVASPTATSPQSGYSERVFQVTGNAGNAPVTVQLFVSGADGSTPSAPAATATASSAGAFAMRAKLPAVSAPTDVTWRVVTSVGSTQFGTTTGTISVQPEFAPTATGRAAGYFATSVPVTGRAVPGDVVTLWRRNLDTTAWTKVATVRAAASTGAFATSFALYRDSEWRVTSRSGATAPAKVVVRPYVRVPRAVTKGTVVYGWGYAMPGKRVAVYKRPIGTSTWRYVGTVRVPSTGRWTGHWRVSYAMNVRVMSHSQLSPVATIRTK